MVKMCTEKKVSRASLHVAMRKYLLQDPIGEEARVSKMSDRYK